MVKTEVASPVDLNESRDPEETRSSKSSRRTPKSWIIAALLFYCASVVTVGLLSGLLPRRTQHVSILGTPTQPPTTTSNPLTCIDDECNPRLLSNLTVDYYELEYMYNTTEQTTVQGQVTIEFTLHQPIRQLIYHSKRMLALETPILVGGEVSRSVSMKLYAPNDYISLRLITNDLFELNKYKLVQRFVIDLTDGTEGFYQTIFKDGNETMQKLLATQFAPTDARKAFPCFDEPHLKAKFRIQIIHPENTIALSNFPTIEETLMNNSLRYTKFQETFLMSTYLAAWAILPDTYGQKTDQENKSNVTVWARQEPTDKNHTAFALEVALHCLPFFTDYFGTSAPIPPKTDLLSVPDLSYLAMENWGLVTFREDLIIFDEKVASTYQKQRLGRIMAHELAHFWFGNYVTCKWWDDLWLNEAMATWLSYKPFGDDYYSDWNMELQALTEDVIPVMWDDAKPSSHPIVVKNVSSAAEITSLFDSITYSKGASILRMLEKIVNSTRFRESLQDYLNANAFGVGDPNTFYNKLFTDMSGEEFMKNWLEEQNYPLLSVNLTVENDETIINFTQSRFIISDALNSSDLDENYRWKINIQCVLGGRYPDSDIANLDNYTIEFMLETEQENRTIPGKSYSWIKCNRGFQGFYVTDYSFPSTTWSRFSNVLEAQPTYFSDEDKVNLIQDAFLLAYKGLIDYTAPLSIIKSLVKIDIQQFVHWNTFEWHWNTLADLVDYLPDTLPTFQNFAIQQILANTTLDNILSINPDDGHNTKLIKGLQFSFLCRMNYTEAIERANSLFESIPIEYFNNSNVDINVGADFLSTVYTYRLKNNGNDTDWNMLYNYYKIAISPQEQIRALIAISSTNNPDRLNQLLNEGLIGGPNTIKRQDYFNMMGYMSRHSVGRDAVWTFYKENYEKLVNTFTLENNQLGAVILSIARLFEKESYLQEMNDLFARYPNAGAGASSRKQAIDQVNMNIEWIRTREQSLRAALNPISRQ